MNMSIIKFIQLAQSEVNLNFVYDESIGDYYCDFVNGKLYVNDNLILEKDLTSSDAGKLKLLKTCFGIKLLQNNYSPVIIQERPERVPGIVILSMENFM